MMLKSEKYFMPDLINSEIGASVDLRIDQVGLNQIFAA